MSTICKVSMVITTASGVLAIVLMWLLYPREVNWLPTLDSSITFMQAQMSGALPPDHRVDWRGDSGMQYKSITITSPGIRSNFKPCVLMLSRPPWSFRFDIFCIACTCCAFLLILSFVSWHVLAVVCMCQQYHRSVSILCSETSALHCHA